MCPSSAGKYAGSIDTRYVSKFSTISVYYSVYDVMTIRVVRILYRSVSVVFGWSVLFFGEWTVQLTSEADAVIMTGNHLRFVSGHHFACKRLVNRGRAQVDSSAVCTRIEAPKAPGFGAGGGSEEGAVPLHRKFLDFWAQKGEFWCIESGTDKTYFWSAWCLNVLPSRGGGGGDRPLAPPVDPPLVHFSRNCSVTVDWRIKMYRYGQRWSKTSYDKLHVAFVEKRMPDVIGNPPESLSSVRLDRLRTYHAPSHWAITQSINQSVKSTKKLLATVATIIS